MFGTLVVYERFFAVHYPDCNRKPTDTRNVCEEPSVYLKLKVCSVLLGTKGPFSVGNLKVLIFVS